MKVFEYLAAGLPVVASRSGQLPAIITDGVEGLLTPPGDPLPLAAAIAGLREQPALRARMRQAARHAALGHTWAAVVDATFSAAQVRPPDRLPQEVLV
jgi:glycosyltransferase involved in cell wall biosynthesis